MHPVSLDNPGWQADHGDLRRSNPFPFIVRRLGLVPQGPPVPHQPDVVEISDEGRHSGGEVWNQPLRSGKVVVRGWDPVKKEQLNENPSGAQGHDGRNVDSRSGSSSVKERKAAGRIYGPGDAHFGRVNPHFNPKET
ncbi:MAG: hypothetical protein O3B01_25520 [Planctomycetota bacterium]|nr:hypothetical protein [Planctomycetota bacterium]MDA1141938.1 hypothetical protein [Planctomycetota bacterium]